MTLDICLSTVVNTVKYFSNSIQWSRVSLQNILDYKEKLNKNINQVHVPRFTYCDNMLCVDGNSNELEQYHVHIVQAYNDATTASTPVRSVRQKSGCLIGWSLEHYCMREKSLFWALA